MGSEDILMLALKTVKKDYKDKIKPLKHKRD
jgi:hypothetical protein